MLLGMLSSYDDNYFTVRIASGNILWLRAYALAFERAFLVQECARVLDRCMCYEESGKAVSVGCPGSWTP